MHNCKRILFVVGAVEPLYSTNTNLMRRLIAGLGDGYIPYVLSVGKYCNGDKAVVPEENLVKYSTETHTVISVKGFDGVRIEIPDARRIGHKIAAHFWDRNGYSDAYDALILTDIINALCKKFGFERICACNEPYKAAFALAKSSVNAEKILYLIDPPAEIVPGLESAAMPFRRKNSRYILKNADLILTTHRIVEALDAGEYKDIITEIVAEEFPLFEPLGTTEAEHLIEFDSSKINLLYCGWLRNEEYLAQIISGLDERFVITFIGNGSERMKDVRTKAEIRTCGAIPKSAAAGAITDTDVLLCIGNPYGVHIPSKVFDYISSGKPVVNFYRIPNCPTLEYLSKYPLALNVYNENAADGVTEDIIDFCVRVKGKSVDRKLLSEIYADIEAGEICRRLCRAIER